LLGGRRLSRRQRQPRRRDHFAARTDCGSGGFAGSGGGTGETTGMSPWDGAGCLGDQRIGRAARCGLSTATAARVAPGQPQRRCVHGRPSARTGPPSLALRSQLGHDDRLQTVYFRWRQCRVCGELPQRFNVGSSRCHRPQGPQAPAQLLPRNAAVDMRLARNATRCAVLRRSGLHSSLVSELLSHGARREVVDRRGQTPFDLVR
jgi:hypothetical protein